MENIVLKLNRKLEKELKGFDYIVTYGMEVSKLLDDYDQNPTKYDYKFIVWFVDIVKYRNNLERLLKEFEDNNIESFTLVKKITDLEKNINIVNKKYEYVKERNWALKIINELSDKILDFNDAFEIILLVTNGLSWPNPHMMIFKNNIDNLIEVGNTIQEDLYRLKTQAKFFSSYSSFNVSEALINVQNKLNILNNINDEIFNELHDKELSLDDSTTLEKTSNESKKKVKS